MQETVLEESIGNEVGDTAEGDDTDYEELVGEEEVTENDQGGEFVLEVRGNLFIIAVMSMKHL